MAKEIQKGARPPLLIIKGTGPEPEPPPYKTNKPGIPPGANPPGLKIGGGAGSPSRDEDGEMEKKPPKSATPLLIIKGTGLEPEPPPYHTNKPGIPPGAVPEELKAQMRRRVKKQPRRRMVE